MARQYNVIDADGHVLGKLITPFGHAMMPPTIMVYDYDVTPADVKLVRVVRESVHKDGFGQNFQLVFAGVTKDAIHITYREYAAEDISRPATSQECSRHTRSAEPGTLSTWRGIVADLCTMIGSARR